MIFSEWDVLIMGLFGYAVGLSSVLFLRHNSSNKKRYAENNNSNGDHSK